MLKVSSTNQIRLRNTHTNQFVSCQYLASQSNSFGSIAYWHCSRDTAADRALQPVVFPTMIDTCQTPPTRRLSTE